MAIKYEFKYMPLVGKLAGKSMAVQTEQAINEIAEIVNDNVAQAEIINRLAEEANANSVEALEKATEALETSGRVYINMDTAVDLDNYCESQLLYINNVASSHLPEALKKGFLEVKTNEDKTEAAQYYTTVDGNVYRRVGTITAQQVGDVTYYVASYGDWEKFAFTDSPAFTGTPTAPTPTVTDDSTKIATTEFVHDVCVPVDVDETANSGNYYSYFVPSGKVFSNFSQIGGKTIVLNQQAQLNALPITGDVQYVNFNDGQQIVAGHKYYAYADLQSGASYFAFYTREIGSVTNSSIRLTPSEQETIGTFDYDGIGDGQNNHSGSFWGFGNLSTTQLTKIQLVDLTLMFGSGNEPTTVAQYKALINAILPYNKGTLLSASVDKVISKDSGNNVLANMPIPSAIQSLDGYGWSAGSVYNYVDFERKKFVKRVASVDLGSLTWTVQASSYRIYSTSLAGIIKNQASENVVANILSDAFEPTYTQNITTNHNSGIGIGTTGIISIGIGSNDSTALNNLIASLSGKILYYELATPVETDISDLLGASGIACAGGGTLTFANVNGSNYKLPVPVSQNLIDGTDGLMTVQDKEKLETAYDHANIDYLPTVGGTITGILINRLLTDRRSYVVHDVRITDGTNPASTLYDRVSVVQDINYKNLYQLFLRHNTSHGVTESVEWNGETLRTSLDINASYGRCFYPGSNGDVKLGVSVYRWAEVYASTGTINTSDERLKDNIEPIPNEVLDAWGEIGWYQFQFKDSIAEKGKNARIHTGAIAQRIKEVFESHNLDAFRYGLLCYDEWDADEEHEAGDVYSLRYEEALCLEAAYQRRRADRLEARIEALEMALNKE